MEGRRAPPQRDPKLDEPSVGNDKNISEDEKWQWAKATEEKRLKGAIDALRKSLTPWEHDLLLADDPRRLAKENTKEKNVCELRHFVDQAKLQKQLKNIVLGCGPLTKRYGKIANE